MRTSLNLLPPKEKRGLQTALAITFVKTLTAYVFLVSLIIAGILLSIKFVMNETADSLAERSMASLEEHEVISQYIQSINDYIHRTDELNESFIDWSAVLETLGHSAPDGLMFESVVVDTDNTITIEGSAASRDDILQMETFLNDLPEFTDIESPLSNILTKENTRFRFVMKYNPAPSN